jgi:hypothetical protein
MKYTLTVEGNKAIEALTINGKTYERTWTNNGHGITSADADVFSERLEADGFDNGEILDAVWDVLDSDFAVSDIIGLCMMDEVDK